MGRKRRQALLDALLVADIDEDLRKDAELGMRSGGDEHPALRHQGQQADRLERHRLAAGVGTGNQQYAKVGAYIQAQRHDGPGIEQRVARFLETHDMRRMGDILGPHTLSGGCRVMKHRSSGIDRSRISRLRQRQIDFRDRVNHPAKRIRMIRDLLAEVIQNPGDLLLLVSLALTPAVVELDDIERLDEQRLTRR